VYEEWTDGLRSLLGKDPICESTRTDVEELVNMELRARLLYVENLGRALLDVPPTVPPPPEDYEFATGEEGPLELS
jgi:hypothetical protein